MSNRPRLVHAHQLRNRLRPSAALSRGELSTRAAGHFVPVGFAQVLNGNIASTDRYRKIFLMTYIIGRQFTFAAAHHLEQLPPGHKCSRIHGHTYTVEVQLTAADLDIANMVCDFGDLDVIRDYIDSALDHRDLNQVLTIQPSCEHIAEHVYQWCRDNLPAGQLVTAVRVSESPRTWAESKPTAFAGGNQ
jgi:6-pyruvoyltetrahydropterin/6-carboxytetrahydropterin synthase